LVSDRSSGSQVEDSDRFHDVAVFDFEREYPVLRLLDRDWDCGLCRDKDLDDEWVRPPSKDRDQEQVSL